MKLFYLLQQAYKWGFITTLKFIYHELLLIFQKRNELILVMKNFIQKSKIMSISNQLILHLMVRFQFPLFIILLKNYPNTFSNTR